MVRNRNSDYLTLYKFNQGICVEIRKARTPQKLGKS